MMSLTTIATAATMLAQPADPPAPAQIFMSSNLIVVSDPDVSLVGDADNDESTFTLAQLQRSGAKILSDAATLNLGESKIRFAPQSAKKPIDLSASRDQATIISAPSVIALDGQEASISIGSDVTIVTSFEGPDQDGFYRVKFDQQMEGIKITFLGEVVPEGIRVNPLDITISSITGDTRQITYTGEGINSPIISTRHLQATLTLPAQSLAIIPIGSMPDGSGFLLATISARAIHGN